MRRLWFRLMGAFVVVIVLGLVVVALSANRAATSGFQLYITREGQAFAERLAPRLASYYAQNQSWKGVDTLLRTGTGAGATSDRGRGSWMMRPDWTMGQDWGWGPMMMGWDTWMTRDLHVLLADGQGNVVADSTEEWNGRALTSNTLTAATPIQVDGRTVGFLAATPRSAASAPSTPATDYLSSVNRSILLAALASGGIALVLGFVLLRQITLPLGALTVAARKIAAGDLQQRVTVRHGDEIGELAQTFNLMADNLAREEELRRNLMADIAHELRNPLTIIQGQLDAMLDDMMPLDAENVASVRDEAALLARLVADLRVLSLSGVGQLKLACVPTDPVDLLQSAVKGVQQAQGKAIDLELDTPESLPSVHVDADRIAQVIRNLVSNAVRYTPDGGRVVVRGRTMNGALEISVIDNGTGIAAEELPHVFDRFYRSSIARTHARDGSGLGLAIVKQLVEAHKGRVGAKSDAGKGTRFWFTLPLPVTQNLVKSEDIAR